MCVCSGEKRDSMRGGEEESRHGGGGEDDPLTRQDRACGAECRPAEQGTTRGVAFDEARKAGLVHGRRAAELTVRCGVVVGPCRVPWGEPVKVSAWAVSWLVWWVGWWDAGSVAIASRLLVWATARARCQRRATTRGRRRTSAKIVAEELGLRRTPTVSLGCLAAWVWGGSTCGCAPFGPVLSGAR